MPAPTTPIFSGVLQSTAVAPTGGAMATTGPTLSFPLKGNEAQGLVEFDGVLVAGTVTINVTPNFSDAVPVWKPIRVIDYGDNTDRVASQYPLSLPIGAVSMFFIPNLLFCDGIQLVLGAGGPFNVRVKVGSFLSSLPGASPGGLSLQLELTRIRVGINMLLDGVDLGSAIQLADVQTGSF